MIRNRDDTYSSVGANISKIRRSKGLSQESLGLAIDLSRTSVINIEKGRQKVLLDTFCNIADALEVSPVDLLDQILTDPQSRDSTSLEQGLKELKPSISKMIREKIDN